MKFEVYVHTYEEGGRVLYDDIMNMEKTLERLYCHGLGDKIGEFVLSIFEDDKQSWEFSYDPVSVYIQVCGFVYDDPD